MQRMGDILVFDDDSSPPTILEQPTAIPPLSLPTSGGRSARLFIELSLSKKHNTEVTMNLYIGNLSHQATEADVQQAFAAFGQVTSATIIKDKFSGESRGFGFVEMPTKAEAEAAMAGLTGKELLGRSLIVNEAHARADDRRGGERRGGGPRSW